MKYLVLKGLYIEAKKRHYKPGEIIKLGNPDEVLILMKKGVIERYNGVEPDNVYRDDDELDKLPRRL